VRQSTLGASDRRCGVEVVVVRHPTTHHLADIRWRQADIRRRRRAVSDVPAEEEASLGGEHLECCLLRTTTA